MTLSDRQCLHTKRMASLIDFAVAGGHAVKVVEWNRLMATQQEYVAKGVSKTLNSKHLDNCATDLYIIVSGAPTTALEDYRAMGVYWETLGGRWGGRFGLEKEPKDVQDVKLGWDVVHFETGDA